MHDFSFTDQSNGWTLPNDDLESSLFFLWDSLHLTEEGKVKLAKLIISSVALRNNIYFLSNTGKRYSYSDTCKNKVSVSFPLTLNEAESPSLPPPIHANKCKHSPYSNNCNSDLCVIHGSNYASSTKNLLVLKLYVLWDVINLLFFLMLTSLFTLLTFVLVNMFAVVLAVNL